MGDALPSAFFRKGGMPMFGNPYQQFQPMMPFQPPQQQGGYEAQFLEVDGKSSISNLVMPPNQRRVYFDRNMDRFYSVSTDALGAKTVSEYEFRAVVEQPPQQYLTVDAFDEWRDRIEQLVRKAANQQGNAGAGAAGYPGVAPAGIASAGHQQGKHEQQAGR